jgi:hypothetical protein
MGSSFQKGLNRRLEAQSSRQLKFIATIFDQDLQDLWDWDLKGFGDLGRLDWIFNGRPSLRTVQHRK